jgi:hypothetical protein
VRLSAGEMEGGDVLFMRIRLWRMVAWGGGQIRTTAKV